jgi:hypothetical protein
MRTENKSQQMMQQSMSLLANAIASQVGCTCPLNAVPEAAPMNSEEKDEQSASLDSRDEDSVATSEVLKVLGSDEDSN